MKALVLAAGLGTRLKPWTDRIPKPLIPVLGVEPLFWALSWLNEKDVQDVIVNVHHLPTQIETILKDFQKLLPKLNLSISDESKKILGSAGGIFKVLHDAPVWDEDLLVINADTLSRIDPTLLKGERSSFAASFDERFFKNYSPLSVDKDLCWQESKNAYRRCHFLGVHFLAREDLSFLRQRPFRGEELGLFESIYKPLAERGRAPQARSALSGNNDFWFDLNQREFFKNAEDEIVAHHSEILSKILKERHPHLSFAEAKSVWPKELS